MKKRVGTAHPPAAVDSALEVTRAFLARTVCLTETTTVSPLDALRYEAGPPTSPGDKLSAFLLCAFQRGTPSTHTAVLPSLRLTKPLSTDGGVSTSWPSSLETSPRLRASSMRWRCSAEKNSRPSSRLAASGDTSANGLGACWDGGVAVMVWAAHTSGTPSAMPTHARRAPARMSVIAASHSARRMTLKER